LKRPDSLLALFLAFNRLALQGFGGVLPVARHELVEHQQWLSPDEFAELLSIGQVLPGPNVINLALMIGHRFFGLRGAFAALSGMMLIPMVLVLALAAVYGQLASHPLAANALRGMGAVSAGLVVATALKIVPSLRRNPMGRVTALAVAAAATAAVLWLHLPLLAIVLGLGGLGMLLAWRGLDA
jgi:chromate transporter